MDIKAEQLEKDIEAIPGVCKEGKAAIKKLFENNFRVKFPLEGLKISMGNRGKIFRDKDYSMMLCWGDGGYHFFSIDGQYDIGHYYTNSPKEGDVIKYKLIASSPSEYFKLKSEGKL